METTGRPQSSGTTFQIPSDWDLHEQLEALEKARKEAEQHRRLWRGARDGFVRLDIAHNSDYIAYARIAIEYARAADRAEELREAYEDAVATRWRADLEAEKNGQR